MRTMFKLSCGVGSVNQTMDTGHLSRHCADSCVSTLTLHVDSSTVVVTKTRTTISKMRIISEPCVLLSEPFY